MKTASVNEVASDFPGYLKASEEGPIVVTRRGKPVAVLLRTSNTDDVERLLMGHSRQLQSILEAARKRFREGQGIPHEELWAEVEAANASKAKKRTNARKSGRSSQ